MIRIRIIHVILISQKLYMFQLHSFVFKWSVGKQKLVYFVVLQFYHMEQGNIDF